MENKLMKSRKKPVFDEGDKYNILFTKAWSQPPTCHGFTDEVLWRKIYTLYDWLFAVVFSLVGLPILLVDCTVAEDEPTGEAA